MNLWAVLLIGLTTGGLSCLAMQGGLLASVIANQKEKDLTTNPKDPALKSSSFDPGDWLPVVMFLGAKLVSHTLLGFLLGALGSVLTLSLGMRITFQLIAALFMLATALNLLNVHPIFRFMSFQPPRFMQRWVKNTTRGSSLFAPATLGFFTIFVPCGVTQAMEILAINSGNPIAGALIMFVFVLGTSPIFGLVGVATAKLSEVWRTKFLKAAALLLIFMFLYSLNGVMLVLDAPISWQKLTQGLSRDDSVAVADVSGEGRMSVADIQRVTINVVERGYDPNRIKVRAGIPVALTVQTNNVYTCAAAFTFREFGIFIILDPIDSETFMFTPTKKGKYTFACSMGMYSGTMEVI